MSDLILGIVRKEYTSFNHKFVEFLLQEGTLRSLQDIANGAEHNADGYQTKAAAFQIYELACDRINSGFKYQLDNILFGTYVCFSVKYQSAYEGWCRPNVTMLSTQANNILASAKFLGKLCSKGSLPRDPEQLFRKLIRYNHILCKQVQYDLLSEGEPFVRKQAEKV